MATSAQVLKLIGPRCWWEQVPNRDAYHCRHCGSRISGMLIWDLRKSLGRR